MYFKVLAVAALLISAGCESKGGAGQTTGGLNTSDGGVKPLPGETCQSSVQCAGGKSYKQCTAAGPPCTGRFITSSNQTYSCATCTDCQAAATMVTSWCGGSTGNDAKCMNEVTQTACINCCIMNHKTGNDYFEMQVQRCECVSPGACAFECDVTYCVDPTTTDSLCDSCVQSNVGAGGTCDETSKCMNDTDCAALLDCVNTCP